VARMSSFSGALISLEQCSVSVNSETSTLKALGKAVSSFKHRLRAIRTKSMPHAA